MDVWGRNGEGLDTKCLVFRLLLPTHGSFFCVLCLIFGLLFLCGPTLQIRDSASNALLAFTRAYPPFIRGQPQQQQKQQPEQQH